MGRRKKEDILAEKEVINNQDVEITESKEAPDQRKEELQNVVINKLANIFKLLSDRGVLMVYHKLHEGILLSATGRLFDSKNNADILDTAFSGSKIEEHLKKVDSIYQMISADQKGYSILKELVAQSQEVQMVTVIKTIELNKNMLENDNIHILKSQLSIGITVISLYDKISFSLPELSEDALKKYKCLNIINKDTKLSGITFKFNNMQNKDENGLDIAGVIVLAGNNSLSKTHKVKVFSHELAHMAIYSVYLNDLDNSVTGEALEEFIDLGISDYPNNVTEDYLSELIPYYYMISQSLSDSKLPKSVLEEYKIGHEIYGKMDSISKVLATDTINEDEDEDSDSDEE